MVSRRIKVEEIRYRFSWNDMWDREPIIDVQFLYLYDYTKKNYMNQEIRYRFSWNDMWDRERIIDVQFLYLYDNTKENYMNQVVADSNVILKRGECKSQILAKEFASQYHHCSVLMSTGDIDNCLAHKENVECKDGPCYHKLPPEFEEHGHTPTFIICGYSFGAVAKNAQKLEAVERSHVNRKLKFLSTRASFVWEKQQMVDQKRDYLFERSPFGFNG